MHYNRERKLNTTVFAWLGPGVQLTVTVYFLMGENLLNNEHRGPEEALGVGRGILFLPGLLDAPIAEVPTIDTTYPFITYLQGFFFLT